MLPLGRSPTQGEIPYLSLLHHNRRENTLTKSDLQAKAEFRIQHPISSLEMGTLDSDCRFLEIQPYVNLGATS